MKQKNNDKNTLKIDGQQVNPVILEIDQFQKQENQSKIIKMTQGKYSGGFKNNLQNKSRISNSQPKKSLYRPQSQSNTNIYSQMGISKAASNYNTTNQHIQNQNNNYSVSQLQSKIALLKKQRMQHNNSILHPQNESQYYNISNSPTRFQEAIHVKSSLDTINLENIQAKLEAHRKKMQPIQEQYNSKIGKNTPIDRYGYVPTNINVDKQYDKIKDNENNGKLYELAKKKIDLQPQDAQFEDLWEQKKKKNPKLAQYDAKYQQYLIEKDAKNIMGHTIRDNLFTWDKYTQPITHHKSKPKLKSKAHKNHSFSKSPTKSNKNQYHSPRSQNSQQEYGPDGLMSIKNLKDVIATKDDKFIASFIFAQLDKSKFGVISKQQLHEYISSQQHIIRGYNIDIKWLYTDLENFQTKRKGMFTKMQLALFLATLQKLQHPKLILSDKSSVSQKLTSEFNHKPKSAITSYFDKNRKIFENLFDTLDFNDDKLIKRQEYIQNIYIDSDCVKLLDQKAIRIEPIDKNITYRQIITYVLDDYRKQKNQKLKKSKEFITFQRFSEYFQVPQSIDLKKIDRASHKKNSQKSTESQMFDLPEEYLYMLKDIFDSLPRIYQNYIVSMDFAQTALRDPQILVLSDQLCRLESVDTRLPLETLGTTLQRLMKQCDQYSNWDTIKSFFSRRGRPMDWDYALILKKKQLRANKLKQERKSVSKSKLRQTQKFLQVSSKLTNKSKQKLEKGPDRYTVPAPFDITDMKGKSLKKDTNKGQQQFMELKKQFKARPVNQQILQSKPDLIAGKAAKKQPKQKQIPSYMKYENYENDRIERALKRAQEKHEQEQRIKAIKQMSKIKSTNVGIDLTKKYEDIIKEKEKKKKQIERKKFNKTTHPQISENLYPKNIKEQNKKKLEKAKKNMEKVDDVNKRKKQLLDEDKNRIKIKNQEVTKVKEQAKNRQKEEKQVRDKIKTDQHEFKPKINKTKLTEQQKQAIKKQKEERQRKKKQIQQNAIKAREEHRKKILQQQFQASTINIQGLQNQQILQKIDDVNFIDLLLDQQSKKEYSKEFPSKGKTKKQLKDRQSGLAGRERARMEKQQKKMMEEKRKYKEKVQKQRTSSKKDSNQFSRISQRGQRSQADLNFHKSKALKRYRAIMEGKQPLSQYDKYSVQNGDNYIQ